MLTNGLAVAAGIVLCALTSLIFLDTVGRSLIKLLANSDWGYTIPWALEVAEYGLYLVTFLGAPWVLRENGHIAVDLLVERLEPNSRRWALIAADTVGTLVCAVLFFYSCRVWWTSFQEGVLIHKTFIFPEWMLLSIAPITFFMMAIIMARHANRPLTDSLRKKLDAGL